MALAPKEPNPFKPIDTTHELLRKTIVNNWIMISIPIVSFLLAFPMALINPWLFILFIMGTICSSLFVYIKISSNQEKFTLKFRESVVQTMIKAKDSSINYEPKSYFNLKEIWYSGLLEAPPNVYEGENYFEQKNPQYSIEIAWAYAVKQRSYTYVDDGVEYKNTENQWLLHGLFYKFSLPKGFKTNIIIRQDKARGLMKMFSQNPEFLYNSFISVPIRYAEFEKEFEVYAQDEKAALEIITPQVIEVLQNIKQYYKKKIQVSFIDTYIYVTIDSGRKYFKPGFVLSKNSAGVYKAVSDAKEVFALPEKMNDLILQIIAKS